MAEKKMMNETDLENVSGGIFVAVGYNPNDPDKVVWERTLMNRSQYDSMKADGETVLSLHSSASFPIQKKLLSNIVGKVEFIDNDDGNLDII